MRIDNIEIKNFKCLGPDSISLDFSNDIIVLVGENNVGKSSVLKALMIYFSGTKTMPLEYFYDKQTDHDHAITITVRFSELTAGDKEHRAVLPYLFEHEGKDKWVLKKSYFYTDEGKPKCDYAAIVNNQEKKNPAGLSQNCDDLFTDEKMQKIFVEAVKNVDEVSGGSSKSTFGQIFNIIIKNALEGTDEYNNLMNCLEEYNQLFQGPNTLQQIRNTEEAINQKLSRIIMATSIIDTDPPKFDSFLPKAKLLTNDGRNIDIDPAEQGHGLQRTLIFALLELLAETTSPISKEIGPRNLLLIEEPEIYMHPQMERKIADVLYDIALSKKAQVLCTTHSPIFIRPLESPQSLIRIYKEGSGSIKIVQKTNDVFNDDEDESRKTMQMIMNFDPSVNELFFAKRIVLVEGYTESAVFPITAELLGIFDENNKHKKRETSIINCRGRDTIILFQKVLNFYEIPYVVIHDLEGQNANEGKNSDILALLNNVEDLRMYFDPKIDDILEINSGKNKWFKAVKQVERLHRENKLESKLGVYTRFVYGI